MNKPLNKDVKGPFLSLGLSMAVLDIIEPLSIFDAPSL